MMCLSVFVTETTFLPLERLSLLRLPRFGKRIALTRGDGFRTSTVAPDSIFAVPRRDLERYSGPGLLCPCSGALGPGVRTSRCPVLDTLISCWRVAVSTSMRLRGTGYTLRQLGELSRPDRPPSGRSLPISDADEICHARVHREYYSLNYLSTRMIGTYIQTTPSNSGDYCDIRLGGYSREGTGSFVCHHGPSSRDGVRNILLEAGMSITSWGLKTTNVVHRRHPN